MFRRKDEIVAKLRDGVETLLRKRQVSVFRGVRRARRDAHRGGRRRRRDGAPRVGQSHPRDRLRGGRAGGVPVRRPCRRDEQGGALEGRHARERRRGRRRGRRVRVRGPLRGTGRSRRPGRDAPGDSAGRGCRRGGPCASRRVQARRHRRADGRRGRVGRGPRRGRPRHAHRRVDRRCGHGAPGRGEETRVRWAAAGRTRHRDRTGRGEA